MSAQGFQHALARILTDAGARDAFLSGTELFLSEYPLNENELEHLRQLRVQRREGMEFFSGLLCKKRGAKVKKLMPLTHAFIDGRLWEDAWSGYCQAYRVESFLTPLADAYRFGEFLVDYVTECSACRPLFRDVNLYERCKLAMASPAERPKLLQTLLSPLKTGSLMDLYPIISRPFTIQCLSYDLTRVIPYLKASMPVPEIEPNPTLFLFYYHWTKESISTARINHSLALLLENCNGRATVRNIVEQLLIHSRVEVVRLGAICEQTLIHLNQRGVIMFTLVPLQKEEKRGA